MHEVCEWARMWRSKVVGFARIQGIRDAVEKSHDFCYPVVIVRHRGAFRGETQSAHSLS